MINFEILETTDFDSIGEFSFIYPSVEIGTKKNSTLRILDPAVRNPIHIKIIGEDKAVIIINSNDGFFCNSKKYFISTLVKSGDIVEFNKLKIKINKIEIQEIFPIDIKKLRKEILSSIQKNNPKLLKILDSIEEDLLHLGVL